MWAVRLQSVRPSVRLVWQTVRRSLGRTDRSVRRSYRVNAQLEKMENRLTNFGSALSATSRQVLALQARPTGSSDQRSVMHTVVPPASVPNIDSRWRFDCPELPVRTADNNTQLAVTLRGNLGVPQVSDSVSVTHTIDDRDQPRSDRPPSHVETRWLVLASTPQSIQHQ